MTRRAPIEALEAMAEAALEVDRIAGRAAVYGGGELGTALQALHKAEDAYRSATAPLRTRAERDADHVKLAHDYYEGKMGGKAYDETYRRLCSEPTRDEPEEESNQERHKRMNLAGIGQMFDTLGKKWAKEREPNATTDHDADLREPERCGCEKAEALKAKVRHIREVCGSYTVSCCAGDVLRILDGES